MADVTLSIGGRQYTVSCRDGEEDHLRAIGALVDGKTADAKAAVGEGMGETRQLLFAALLLADEVKDLRGRVLEPQDLDRLEQFAGRLSRLGEKLAPAARSS